MPAAAARSSVQSLHRMKVFTDVGPSLCPNIASCASNIALLLLSAALCSPSPDMVAHHDDVTLQAQSDDASDQSDHIPACSTQILLPNG